MVRTGAMYYERLKSVLDKCLVLGATIGVFGAELLSRELGISERALRDYLRDLLALGVLEYLGDGLFRVNFARLEKVNKGLEGRLDITDFFDEEVLAMVKSTGYFRDRIERVFEKMNIKFLLDPDLRDKVLSMTVNSGLRVENARVMGDRLIIQGIANFIPLNDVYIGGGGYSYDIKNVILYSHVGDPFGVLTFGFVYSVSYAAYMRDNSLVHERSTEFRRPDFRRYNGKEPAVRGDPFYEMVTAYPELLDLARRLAIRFIAQKVLYETALDVLDRFGSDLKVFFLGGSLLPHGFVVQAKALLRLKARVEKLFDKLVSTARKQGVLIAGINFRPHDNIFVQLLEQAIGHKIPFLNDTNVLLFLLENRDTTVPINRFAEKGRLPLDSWYEFYMKIEERIIKVEYISNSNPFRDYAMLRDYIYSTFVPSPVKQEVLAGPGPMVHSVIKARSYLKYLRNTILGIVNFRFRDYLDKLYRGVTYGGSL